MIVPEIATRQKSIVSPEALKAFEREALALRLLETAYELRTCYDAIGGIEKDMSAELNSHHGIRSIIGRHMRVVADAAEELFPGLAKTSQD